MDSKINDNKIKKYSNEGYEKILKDYELLKTGSSGNDLGREDILDILELYKNVSDKENGVLCCVATLCDGISQRSEEYHGKWYNVSSESKNGKIKNKIYNYDTLREAVLKTNFGVIKAAEELRKMLFSQGRLNIDN